MNSAVEFWFLEETKQQVVQFRDATIKEFLAAHWVAKYGTEEDARKVESWVYVTDRPVHYTDTNPQFAWFWRYLCEMPAGGRSPMSWLSAIAPLYQPSTLGRPCEMMCRAWKTLMNYAEKESYQPEAPARPNPTAKVGLPGALDSYSRSNLASEIVHRFLAEFPAILMSAAEETAKIAAELVPEPVLAELVEAPYRLKAIRPASDAPAFVRCPPWSVEEAERKRRGDRVPAEGLDCHRFWRGTALETRDRNGNEFWRDGREDPRHEVQLTPFWLKATHVTRAEFALFDSTHEHALTDSLKYVAPQITCPVLYVSWYQSWCLAAWCGLNLPTEAQFEFGVRAGHDEEQDLFPQGDTASAFQINCAGKDFPFAGSKTGPWLSRTVPVRCRHPRQHGQAIENVDYAPNDWGIWHSNGQAWV